ncbi:TPA: hypothetical protein DIV48_02585 [Candidatus Kaiserbacteria bacterium]|nr:MAG: hypothetical protein UY93_C0002G0359 [Parcubacteria group bacterium GW2011_GWA1_56_13]KKW46096.1 MAG: hypothetical protein UY97_C0010G0019 [Parcubacteria group bacterium GW2011_GWB1_57_6]HCR52513.1 hypothetical protein [Candidatus Kaiserbacteria bacterium]
MLRIFVEKFVDKEHKLIRWKTLFVWGPIQALLGFFLFYFIASFAFEFLNGSLGAKYFVHNSITVGATFFLAFAYFYLLALAKVKEAYVGQPTLLGARRNEFVLPEGYSLILPWPFMGYSEIPVQPTTTELKEPMEILVSKQPEKDNDGTQPTPPVQPNPNEPPAYQVRMKISMSILWEVEPENILSYTAVDGGRAGVEKALVEVMRRSIRERAQHLSDTQVFTGQEVFATEVQKALEEDLDKNKPGMSLVKRLGIKIIKVQTVKIVPSDEELTKRYERLRSEDLDKQAETNQANHLADNLVDKFKSKGVSADMAFLGALAMTKDAKLVGVVGNAGDFTKGQVAAGEGGGR